MADIRHGLDGADLVIDCQYLKLKLLEKNIVDMLEEFTTSNKRIH